ncbi:chaperone protein EcpD [Pseudomonas lurida]
MKSKLIIKLFLLFSLCNFLETAIAGITLDRTRLIYNGSDKETSFLVSNKNDQDVMLQSWVEGTRTAPEFNVPFIVTPTLVKVGPGRQQKLRLFYKGSGLPANQETVLWMVVQEIPQKIKTDGSLVMAVRQKIKLFYRPETLTGTQSAAAHDLQFVVKTTHNRKTFTISNPSPYHVTIAQKKIDLHSIESKQTVFLDDGMLSPFETREIELEKNVSVNADNFLVEFDSVNDFGGLDKIKITVKK